LVTITGNVPAVARSLAVREIVSWVELTNVGVCPTPLNVTVELDRNPLPLIVRFCGVAPTVSELGDRDAMTGKGLTTVRLTAFDGPPPGAGFVTTTGNAPVVARSLALRKIVSWVVFTNVGVCAMPLSVTVEFVRNPVPLIVRFCGGAPTVTEVGEREVIEGTGLPPPAAVTVKGTAFDAPPPGAGLVTTTG
jgi:hypothetical protein